MVDLSGQTIHGYKFLEVIGEGGFATVYKATQISVDRTVAVKAVTPKLATSPDFAREFQLEATLVAKLEHPSIVPIHDFWHDDQGAFIVMRLLTGGTLRELIAVGKIEPLRTAELFQQIASGLNFAHRHGIVHRDIKPENIMFDGTGTAYLSDFGLAKPIGFEDSEDEMVSGTLMYMSPEQLSGLPPSPASDIYSVGIMLHEMLTGRHPFMGLSTTEIIMKHMNENLQPVGTMASDISFDIDEILRKLTHKEEQERYQSILDAAKDFNKALNRESFIDESFEPSFTVDSTEQAQLIRQIISENVQDLENMLYQLYEQVSTEKDVDFQEEVEKIRLRKSFRMNSLKMLESSLAPLGIPESLKIPDAPPVEIVASQAHFDDAKQALLDKTSIALLGPAGVGKSTLAHSLARDEEVNQAFTGNVVQIYFGEEPDLMMALADLLIMYGFDQDLSEFTTIEDRIEILNDIVENPILIIADNVQDAEHILEELDALEIDVTWIATTRSTDVAFDLDYKIIDVIDFSMDKRFELLNLLISEIDLTVIEDEVREFLTRIGGLPGDIQLIAGKLKRARRDVSRFRREMKRIQEKLVDTLQTSYQLFKTSVDDLDEEVRDALRNIAILPPDPSTFSETAGEAIAESIDYLHQLVDTSLLKSMSITTQLTDFETRFAMYPTFSEFSLNYLQADSDAYQRVVDFFMTYIRQHNTDFPNLSHERENLEAVLKIALKQSLAKDFIECVVLLNPYWRALGMLQRAEDYAKESLKLVDTISVPKEQHAQLLLQSASIAYTKGDMDTSKARVSEGLKQLDDADDTPAIRKMKASLIIQQARIYMQLGQFDQASVELENAKQVLADAPEHHLLSELFSLYGGVDFYSTRDMESAYKNFNQSLYHARIDNNKYRMCAALITIARIERGVHRNYSSANAHLATALQYAREINHAEMMSDILATRGQLELMLENSDAARNFFEEAVVQANRAHSARWIGGTHNLKIMFHTEMGEFEEAEKSVLTVLERAMTIKDPIMALDLTDYLFKCGANRIKAQQLEFDTASWHRVSESLASFDLPETSVSRFQEAYQRLINFQQTKDSHEAMHWACYQLGLLERDDFNDPELALTHFEAAIDHATTLKTPQLIMDSFVAKTETLAMLNNFDDAEMLIVQILTSPRLRELERTEAVSRLLNQILDEREESNNTTFDDTIWRTLSGLLDQNSDYQEIQARVTALQGK